jgi:hypothetical protein
VSAISLAFGLWTDGSRVGCGERGASAEQYNADNQPSSKAMTHRDLLIDRPSLYLDSARAASGRTTP